MNNRKLLLSYLRKGDYAHAGETEAIELAMQSIPQRSDQLLLDVGCGLGGTADYLEKQGFGKVIGIDVDHEMIDYASLHYPSISFHLCDVLNVSQVLSDKKFDIIYSFNAFFSFPEQEKSLAVLSRVAKENATLILFDYSSPQDYLKENIFYDHASTIPKIFSPINMSTLENTLSHNGWQLDHAVDITSNYDTWYQWLIHQMEKQKIELIQRFSQQTFDDLYEGYCKLLNLIHKNKVGGVIVYAKCTNEKI